MPVTKPHVNATTVRSQRPPRLFWVISALLVGLFWALAALKHALLQSTGFDLGIFDQVAWKMSQNLVPHSTFTGLHHLGDHGAWASYAIAPFYWLTPSVHWLFFTQALALILTAWPLWHLGAQAGLKPRERWLICGLWQLQPLVFNVNLFDFHPGTWAMPFLVLSIWANRAERRWLWIACLFLAMGCKTGIGFIVVGIGLEQGLRQRGRWAVEALLIGGGYLFFAYGLFFPALNNHPGLMSSFGRFQSRYSHLGDGIGDILQTALFSPIKLLGVLDWPSIVFYLFLLSLPLAFYWRRSSLPMLATTLPLIAVNSLSSYELQRDLLHESSLHLLVPLIVASMDGFATDLRCGRPLLANRLWFCAFWAALCFILLPRRAHNLDIDVITKFNEVQPAYNLIMQIPNNVSVLTQNHLAPQLSQRPLIRVLTEDMDSMSDFTQFDVVLLDRKSLWGGGYGLTHTATATQHTAATIEQLQAMSWDCEEHGQSGFVLCRRPT